MTKEILIKLAKWTKVKFRLNISEKEPVYFREREIWWVNLGANIGYEQDGKNERFARPVLILKKFNKYVFWILPLTRTKKNNKYYFKIKQDDSKESFVILSQIRLIDAKRLIDKLGVVQKDDFMKIKKTIVKFLTDDHSDIV